MEPNTKVQCLNNKLSFTTMPNNSFSHVFKMEYYSCGAEPTSVQVSPEAPGAAVAESGGETSQLLLSHPAERQ
jgi:hypothetical protein